MAEIETEGAQGRTRLRRWALIAGACIVLAGVAALVPFVSLWWAGPPAGTSSAGPASRGVKSTLDLDSFLVNLADTENARFLKVTFRLGVADKTLARQLAADPVVLAATRDAIISLLTSKTADQILTAAGKDRLREEVRIRVNSILPRGTVGEVYIVDFVVQM